MSRIDDDEARVQEAREHVEYWEDKIKRSSSLNARRCQQERQKAKTRLQELLKKLGREEDEV